MFSLLTNNTVNMGNPATFAKALDHITSNYSAQMKDVVVWLAAKGHGNPVTYLLEQISGRVATEMDDALRSVKMFCTMASVNSSVLAPRTVFKATY
jgi:hypothetical protein